MIRLVKKKKQCKFQSLTYILSAPFVTSKGGAPLKFRRRIERENTHVASELHLISHRGAKRERERDAEIHARDSEPLLLFFFFSIYIYTRDI